MLMPSPGTAVDWVRPRHGCSRRRRLDEARRAAEQPQRQQGCRCDGGRESSTDRHADDAVEERAFWWLTHVTSTLLRGFCSTAPRGRAQRLRRRSSRSPEAGGAPRSARLRRAPRASWYLTLFQRILDTSEIAPSSRGALGAQGRANAHRHRHCARVRPALLAASDFDHWQKVCGTVCASHRRLTPTKCWRTRQISASCRPRSSQSGVQRRRLTRRQALSVVGAEPETPRAIKRAKWGWW